MERERLYMVALMPPPKLTEQIEAIRKGFAEAYHCKAALKPPVHITLYPPYKESETHEDELKAVLARWCSHQRNFDVHLSGFNAFRQNGVIFIDVKENLHLKELHKGFTAQMTKLLQPDIKSRQSYHPHITIGYRDIPPALFSEAVKDYVPQKFEASFAIDAVYFWRHNGKHWETIHTFPFQKPEDSVSQSALF
jgi:2'-5' RNA ligase